MDYNDVRPVAAGSARSAEFEVPSSRPTHLSLGPLLKMLISANDQVVGNWRGGRLGVISILGETATANGDILYNNSIERQRWGLSKEASTKRIIRAVTDFRRLPSTWPLETWPLPKQL